MTVNLRRSQWHQPCNHFPKKRVKSAHGSLEGEWLLKNNCL